MTTQAFQNPLSRSLGLHLIVLSLAFVYITSLSHPLTANEPIEITLSDRKAEKVKIHEDDQKNIIVQKSEGDEVKKAKKDSYLSDKTRVVKIEESAKNSGEASVIPSTPRHETAQENTKPKPEVKLSDLGMKIVPKVAQDFNQQRNWANSQTGETLRGGQYIQGMKEGEVSALNTKEFVFYSYFDRVRKQLDQAWQPILRENIQRIFKAGRRLASHADFVTKTLVTLNQKGEIVRVQLLEESGTHDLDQAAVDALNKAGPYPNPPKGLIDASGLVQIRWDFVLKT